MTDKRQDDPIDDYIEWTEHRYDPGHYLGGNISPLVRGFQRLVDYGDDSPPAHYFYRLSTGAALAVIGGLVLGLATDRLRFDWITYLQFALAIWGVFVALLVGQCYRPKRR